MRRARFLAFLAVLAAAAGQVAAQTVRVSGGRALPRMSVTGLHQLAPFGKSVDWSPDGARIATARPGANGFYDVVVLDLEGSTNVQLTRGRPSCPQLHNGNPSWHPSGDYIVFTAENPDVAGPSSHRIAIPGRGVNCNLWLARADGSRFWQLTHNPTDFVEPHAVIHPQLSPDGTQLLWAERIANRSDTWWGEWEIRTARLVLNDGEAYLDDIVGFQPGRRRAFYEAHDWNLSRPTVLLSGNLESGQPEWGLDVYELNLDTNEVRRLTGTITDWDEHAHWSPTGRYVTWMSSRGFDLDWTEFDGHNYGEILATELWSMGSNATGPHRLTHFNDRDHPHHIPGSEACIVSDSSWSPDGRRIVVDVFCRMLNGARTARLVLLDVATGGSRIPTAD